MGSTGINHLPPELLCKIFSNLSISSKLACRAVSATWNDIVSLSSELWPGENLEPFSVPKNMLKFSWSLFFVFEGMLIFSKECSQKVSFSRSEDVGQVQAWGGGRGAEEKLSPLL